jgi:hypothetical protein
VSEFEFTQSFDARDWARAYVEMHGGDEGLMLGWFANAIMRGYDEAVRRGLIADEAAAEVATLRAQRDELKAALSALLAHEVYTYEGKLEAQITVPQDAVDTAREVLARVEGQP